ncbi:MAG: Tfp pilus assembly protein FimT/FimU [Phycisphaerales bacterium JB065]
MSTASVQPTRHALGLTLVELLAVLVILGLIVSVAAVGLSSRSTEARLSDAASALASLDTSARVLSRKGHLIELRFDLSSTSIELKDLCCEDGAATQRRLPAGLILEIWEMPSGVPTEQIRIDSRGQSDDYQVRISVQDQGVTLAFAGLTGWYEIIRSDR